MNFYSSRYPLFIALLVSLLIHWLSLTMHTEIPSPSTKPQPIYVDVLPAQPQRETALPQQPEKVPIKAKRQGSIDQSTPKEQAPQGSANEDSSAVVAQPKALQPQPEKEVIEKPKQQTTPVREAALATQDLATPQPPLPTLEQLLNSSATAAADVARSAQSKLRPDVENGDALILNMEKDKLFSFFSRFKKGVYNVWNYPQEAIDKRQQGLALLKIVVNRDGTIDDVDLIRGSGFERLDREAIAAIFKGQPYGALPPDYPDAQLTINAYFEYILGQSKPNIYRQGY
ncbi:MAG: TonB family protein [Desulfuromonas sp.]|nr:TonB family protein [Desulfuromonas sp.]